MKRALFLILLFAPLLAEGVRPQRDRIGFSTTPEQLTQVIELAQKRSPVLLAEMERKTAGKTAFVRGLARGLGAREDDVASPTFVLLTTYAGRLRLHHADLIIDVHNRNNAGIGANCGFEFFQIN